MAQPAPPPGTPPSGPPPVTPAYPPPIPPYYYPPPPPKSSNIVLIIVIVVIVIVVGTVVAAAVLYFMVSGLISGDGSNPPIIALSPASVDVNFVTTTVTGASRIAPTGAYQANMIVNSTVGTARTLSSGFTITVGAESFQVTFTDGSASGQLDPGDQFRIVATSGFHPSTDYQFELTWASSGSPVAFVSWSTP